VPICHDTDDNFSEVYVRGDWFCGIILALGARVLDHPIRFSNVAFLRPEQFLTCFGPLPQVSASAVDHNINEEKGKENEKFKKSKKINKKPSETENKKRRAARRKAIRR
jgi:hypothetical protein